MLGDKWAAIDANNVVMRESLVELFLSHEVGVRVAICRHQNSSVYDEEVCVSRRQASAIFIITGLCHR